jgi:predicted metal-binding membrane protein
MTDAALEALLRRDRIVVAGALVLLIVLSWSYVLWIADDMTMGGMDMPGYRMIPAGQGFMMPVSAPWGTVEFAFVLAMWAVMMVGMMTPSVAPMVLIYARVARQAASTTTPFAATSWFAAGYLLAWIAFSLAATLAQWAVERWGGLTASMAAGNDVFAGLVLMAAGLYQWTPLKDACLRQCQAPLQFIQRHGGFQQGAAGSVALGLRHGLYCIGCCWLLMALLFVGGVMNVLWIAVLAILVLLEKVVPAGRLISRLSGIGCVVAGAWMIARAL